MQIDVLIVGQGLAGSLLAWELMRLRYRVLVVDNGDENASQVAAGLINPVTGQRLVKSRDVDTLLPAAMQLYRQLGLVFKTQFFVELPMLRILHDERELTRARQRLSQADYQVYLRDWMPGMEGCITAFGVLRQCQTGYLRTRPLLARLRDFFIANDSYRQTRLDYRDIALQPSLQWRNVKPRHIVFCEGYQAGANPWFYTLPFQLAKGEILGCETGASCPKHIINYGHWLIPLDERRFKTGATFDPRHIDLQQTSQAETRLLGALHAVYPRLQPVSVYEHKAGIRPATLDKQPFIGAHPRHGNLHIFNGFGAKGSLSIPWYCRQFIDALEQRAQLSATCHIRRFYDSHFLT